MGLTERAELVARLSLKDDFSGPRKRIEAGMGSMGRAAGRAGKAISVGLGAGLAIGAAVTTRAVTSGLQSLAELESATTSVDAAIKQMGITGKVTSGQIATWANEIEASVGAAFDDKAITQAATTLIRFGKITPANLRPALVVMTDLATKTGSVDSAAALLAKALADPTKAAGKLARSGVILTKTQQDQIKALVKAGKTGKAQALILDALSKATKGAAAASQGPYQRSISMLHDAWEDATKALAVGFLPVLEEVRDILSKELAKPETLNRIRDFGKGLAGGLSSLIDAAKKVPWAQVGDAMRLAGQGAKAAYDLFTGLPPWVQTAVLTGWGLNKLTGGALGSIVGELGKGLIKGVLGMTAGVVNARAGVVNVTGGVGGAGGAAGGVVGGKGGGLVGGLLGVLGVVSLAAVANEFAPQVTQFGIDLRKQIAPNLPVLTTKDLEWPFGPKNTPTFLADILGGNGLLGGTARVAPFPYAGSIDPKERQYTQSTRFTGIPYTPTRSRTAAGDPKDQTPAAVDKSKVALSGKLTNLERKMNETKTGIVTQDRTSGSAIVSQTRTSGGGIERAIGVLARAVPIVTVSVKVDRYGNATYQTGTTMSRVTTGVGSAELQRQTG